MGKRLLIVTEGGSNIGLGHIVRCLSLAQAFEQRGIDTEFVVYGDAMVKDLLRDKNYTLIDWLKKGIDVLPDSRMTVVDSYLAGSDFYKWVSETVRTPVFIDDNNRLNYPRGVVVNGNVYAPQLDYVRHKESQYLLGTAYAPLRESFWFVEEKTIGQDVQEVMVTLGGEDVTNTTPAVVSFLRKFYPGLKKKVIIGRGFKNIDQIKAASDDNTELVYYPDAAEMKAIMMDADIAFSNGGQTLYELARVGVPTLAICVADNQLRNVQALGRIGFLEYFVWKEKEDFTSAAKSFLEQHKHKDARAERSQKGRRLVDGKGVKNIVEKVLSYG